MKHFHFLLYNIECKKTLKKLWVLRTFGYIYTVIKNNRKMEIERETAQGTLNLRNIMVDVDGTNLEEGIEVVHGESTSVFLGYIDLDDNEAVDRFIEENF